MQIFGTCRDSHPLSHYYTCDTLLGGFVFSDLFSAVTDVTQTHKNEKENVCHPRFLHFLILWNFMSHQSFLFYINLKSSFCCTPTTHHFVDTTQYFPWASVPENKFCFSWLHLPSSQLLFHGAAAWTIA